MACFILEGDGTSHFGKGGIRSQLSLAPTRSVATPPRGLPRPQARPTSLRLSNPPREPSSWLALSSFHFVTFGKGGIRTLGTDLTPYNGLANRRFRPLSHLSILAWSRQARKNCGLRAPRVPFWHPLGATPAPSSPTQPPFHLFLLRYSQFSWLDAHLSTQN